MTFRDVTLVRVAIRPDFPGQFWNLVLKTVSGNNFEKCRESLRLATKNYESSLKRKVAIHSDIDVLISKKVLVFVLTPKLMNELPILKSVNMTEERV